MKKAINFLFYLLIAQFIFSCTNSKNDSKNSQSLTINNTLDSLSFELNNLCKKSIIPGFAVAIIKNDKLLYYRGFGFSDLESNKEFNSKTTNFIASISKTFIGLSVIKLVEDGKLNLEDEINSILPFDVTNPHFPNTPITIKHLVTHTAGLQDEFDPESVGEADIILLENIEYEIDSIQNIMDEELSYYRKGIDITPEETLYRYLSKNGKWYSKDNFDKHKPGTRYNYSNLGSELAALIVEITSGMKFSEFTKQYIFNPLKMNNTDWFYENLDSNSISKIYFPNDWNNPKVAIEHPKYQYTAYASGGLKSNIEDLAKYAIEMIKGSNGKGSLLTNESYKLLFRPSLDSLNFDYERSNSPLSDDYNVGIFWSVSSTGMVIHNGGSIGVYSFLYFDPKTMSGALGFSNLPDSSFGRIRSTVYRYERKICQ